MVARELLLQGAKVDVATGWRGCCRYRVARVLLLQGAARVLLLEGGEGIVATRWRGCCC